MLKGKEGLTLAVVGSLFVASACSGGTEVIATPSNPRSDIPEHTTPPPTPSFEEKGLFNQHASTYYPELLTSELALSEVQIIPIDSEHKMTFHNLSAEFDVDEFAVQQVINAFNEVPSLQETFEYTDSNPVVRGEIDTREPKKDIVFFVLPPEFPRTTWNQNSSPAISHGLLGTDEVYKAFAEQPAEAPGGPLELTVRDELSRLIGTELCQLMVEARAATEMERIFTQEIGCNSLSIALWFKQRGYNFDEYQASASRVKLGASGRLHAVAFKKDVYEVLPAEQLVDPIKK